MANLSMPATRMDIGLQACTGMIDSSGICFKNITFDIHCRQCARIINLAMAPSVGLTTHLLRATFWSIVTIAAVITRRPNA